MKSRSVRLALLATCSLILCSSCSKNDGQEPAREAGSPPDISPAAAPGVAFNYAYEFGLPDKRIAATQETHAAACEKLGLAHCRITGMSYSVDQDEQVVAELDLKLDPSIARQFGKSAQQSVEGNEGKLIRLQIGSSDEGRTIDQATTLRNDVSAQAAQLEEELSKTRPGTSARANLVSQIQARRQQASEQDRAIEAGQEALANTPMELRYYGRGGVPGFRGNPIREAWQTLMATVVWLIGTLLQVVAVMIPLVVLVAVLVALWRSRPMRAFRGWIKVPMESAT